MKKQELLKSLLVSNWQFVTAAFVLVLYLSPNIFFADYARYLIHDNLDSNVTWYKNLAESGYFFSANDQIIPNSLGGIPRGCYPSEYNINHLFYLFFSPLVAYNLNVVLVHLLAFFGMLLFSKTFLFNNVQGKGLPVFISLLFALLPFWPSGGSSLASQPFLLYAFINIFRGDYRVRNWLIIAIVPFVSILLHANIFLIILLSSYYVGIAIKNKRIDFRVVAALLLFITVSIFTEKRLLQMQFLQHFESHRSLSSVEGNLNIKGVIGVSILHFLKGQYHFLSLQYPGILLFTIFSLIIGKKSKEGMHILKLLILVYFISILYVLPSWNEMQGLLKKFPLLALISLRFYSLFPLLWFIIFGLASAIVSSGKAGLKIITPLVFVFVGVCEFFALSDSDYYGSEFAENGFYHTYIDRHSPDHATFDEYYKINLISEMKKTVKPGDYYVACLGIAPEVFQYNGYWTIDGYYYYYPKIHAIFMSKVCEKERSEYDNQIIGNRCYLWSKEMALGTYNIKSLNLNFELLKEKNTRYIFSRNKIQNRNLANEIVFSTSITRDSIFCYNIK